MKKHILLMAGAVIGLLVFATESPIGASRPGTAPEFALGHGSTATLQAALAVWRENYQDKGGSAEVLKLGLGYSKVLSPVYTPARGQLQLNLENGALSFQTAKLEDGAYALWLIDNANGTVQPQSEKNVKLLGEFSVSNGSGGFESRLQRNQLLGFTLDAVAVTKAGQTPLNGSVIYGATDLMHKLYYANRPTVAALADFSAERGAHDQTFGFLLPKAAQADTVADLTPVLGALVANGRQVFHHETFAGNGRTCGTCHRAENNFTLDPEFILTLPANDPLFVAETNTALANLENPTLLRNNALILTNIDGATNPVVFRSVPHTLSLTTSIKTELLADGGDFAQDAAFANATGWSGDGAPGSGSLREFALGAIAQHMPQTLNRIAGADFRVPTSQELDEIEAYLLSLGRSKDYPIYQLTFNDPLAQAGKVLFDTKQNPCTNNTAQSGNPASCPSGQSVVEGLTANCNGCHQNAGARSSTTNDNPTRDTGIERLKINSARLQVPGIAYDGGFGEAASTTCGPNYDQSCFGDGRFNTPPLIEAADTAPYFHNNTVSTLEEAVGSYNNDAFNASPGALTSKKADRRVKLDASQVTAVASFLRAVNALENIRLSDGLDSQAKQISANATARELGKLSLAELKDAITVLKEGKVLNSSKAVAVLERASYLLGLAQVAPVATIRNALLNQAQAQKAQARALIASCNPSAPVPSTVVPPPAANQYACSEIGF